MDTPEFDRLVRDWPAAREHLMARHFDHDSDGLADQADPNQHGLDPYRTGDGTYPSWPGGWQIDPAPQAADGPCEDRHDPSSWLDPDIVDDPTEGG